MALLLRHMAEGAVYCWHQLWTYADPRTEHLPLVKNPMGTFAVISGYLLFVLALGPHLMRDRKPFKLDKIMMVYNAVQVVWCAYLAVEATRLTWWRETYSFACDPLSWNMEKYSNDMALMVYSYFILKIVDTLDTVFMVLRKNNRQISFLHVYHHSCMIFAMWIGSKFYPGGHHVFLGLINCIVHCVLYGYYLVSVFEPRVKSAWWKKYITLMQLVQFGMNLVHEALPFFVPGCGTSKLLGALLFIQNICMFALFGDFYYKCYIRRRPQENDVRNKNT